MAGDTREPPVARAGDGTGRLAGSEDPRQFFDAFGEQWNKLYGQAYYRERLEILDRWLKTIPAGAVGRRVALDLGCGTAQAEAVYSRQGWQYHGADFSFGMLHAAGSGLRLICCDGHRLPLPAGAVEAVQIFNVLEFVPDRLALLREAFRVLAPGGTLLLAIANSEDIFERAKRFRLCGRPSARGGPRSQLLSPPEARELLAVAGFAGCRVFAYGMAARAQGSKLLRGLSRNRYLGASLYLRAERPPSRRP
jgi:SAM-dependent methyltransferase